MSAKLRLAIRAYGPISGLLIWLARITQKHIGHWAAWPFWTLSDRYQNWRFWRRYDRIMGKRRRAAAGKEPT